MPVFNNILAGAAGSGGAAADYEIKRSVRFNREDTPSLSKNFSSAGNQQTWTWSAWVKRSSVTTTQSLFNCYSGADNNDGYVNILFNAQDKLSFSGWSTSYAITNRQFRDPSAWYHIVIAVDQSLSNTSDRIKIYVNGVAETFSTYNASRSTYPINSAITHNIGSNAYYANTTNKLHGYLAEINFVDGQQLAATNFGRFVSGVWNPKEYTGTYGTNGFHLDFSDNSNDDALGYDAAGSNNWTVTNITSGAQIANQGFDCVTYTGNGSSQNIPLNFEPGLIWTKGRNNTEWHTLVDTLRPTSRYLYTNSELGESANQSGGVTATSSTGYTIGSSAYLNQNNYTYVAWCWKAGGTGVLNENGSIDSTVSANTTYGFSVITYQGDGSTSSPSIGHGLEATPAFVIIKNRDGSQSYPQWTVKHKSLDSNKNIRLQLDAGDDLATGTNSWYEGGIGNLTSSSVISFVTGSQNSTNNVNKNGNNYVCYAWSEVPGFSKFGSWTGNGNPSGPTVTLGFKPRWVLFKRTDQSGDNWTIFDTARDSGTLNIGLQPNVALDEQTFGNRQIVVSDTGFQVTSTGSSSNALNGKYIYAAFADGAADDIDSLLDSPTNYEADTGNNGGNYCTWNPLATFTGVQGISVAREYTQGNLKVKIPSGNSWAPGCGTISVNSGKWYAEFEMADASGSNHFHVGINPPLNHFTGVTYHSASETGHWYGSNGQMWNAGTAGSVGAVDSANNGDVIGVALDFSASTVTFYKNGTSLTSVSLNSNITTYGAVFGFDLYPTCSCIANFGQRPFKYSVPTGHKALCTQNLDDAASGYFDVLTYSGDGQPSQAITGYSFEPDLLWIKEKSAGSSHGLWNTVVGTGSFLSSDLPDDEFTTTTELSSINSNGFTVGANTMTNETNQTYVAWAWDAGTSFSNSAGSNGASLASSGKANQSAGFSIVTWTGNSGTVLHGLNGAPELIISKIRNTSSAWPVQHSHDTSQFLRLDEPDQAASDGTRFSAAPTSSVFSVGSWWNSDSGGLAYCFRSVEGFSKVGMYEGAGPERFVHCGFRPAFVLYKNFDASAGWQIYDSARSTFNVCDERLQANSASAEDTTVGIDILSNGFITKSTHARTNTSGNTYLFVAFAENPFKTARAR